MQSMLNLFFVALVTLSVNAQAADSELPYSSVECGDHWLEINVSLDKDSNKAEISFRGDSSPDVTERVGTYTFSGNDLRVEYTDFGGGFLALDGSDHYHNIFWGTGKSESSQKNEESYGLCDVK
jgi:hypothetical protein